MARRPGARAGRLGREHPVHRDARLRQEGAVQRGGVRVAAQRRHRTSLKSWLGPRRSGRASPARRRRTPTCLDGAAASAAVAAAHESLCRRRRGARPLLGGAGRTTATGWSSAPRRRRCWPPATRRWGATFRCSCIRRRTRNMRWRAPSARPARATTASCSTPRPTSRCSRTWRVATSRSTRSPQDPDTGALIDPFGGQRRHAAPACCATSRRRSPKTRCACCDWRASRRAGPTSRVAPTPRGR